MNRSGADCAEAWVECGASSVKASAVLRGGRGRGGGGVGCLKRGARRAGSALSRVRRWVVFGLEGRVFGVILGGWCAGEGQRVVEVPQLGSVR